MFLIVIKDKYSYFTINSNDSEKRLDNVIRRFLPDMNLTNVFKSIRAGDIRVNGKKVKQNYRLIEGDVLAIYSQFLSHTANEKIPKSKSGIIDPKRIVFENKDILVYNKPRGVLVHGEDDSLDVGIKSYLKTKVIDSLSFSPGPLHRLDRNTQGLITFSISLNGARTFTNMIKNGEVKKLYLAVVDGTFSKNEEWEDKISRDEKTRKSFLSDSGKVALTSFYPIFSKNGKTIAIIEIKSGRTHQIRVQCAIHNRPLTGDIKYNSRTNYKEYFLTAISLSFTKKSDILDINTISIPLSKTSNNLIKSFLTQDEIKSVEKIIEKELEKL